jgi:hypothetical protein
MKDLLRLTVPIALDRGRVPGLADATGHPHVRQGTVTSAGKARPVRLGHHQPEWPREGSIADRRRRKILHREPDPGTYDFVVERREQLYQGRATLPIMNGTFNISF